MNIKELKTYAKSIIIDLTKLLVFFSCFFVVIYITLLYETIFGELSFVINRQDNSTIAKSTIGRLYLTEREAERFDERTASIMNDVIMFKSVNKIKDTSISMAVELGIISSDRFWHESKGYYIYTARPFSIYRRLEDDPVLKLDVLCTLPMPSDLMCSAYDEAPKFIQQATAGKHSILLYFKKTN